MNEQTRNEIVRRHHAGASMRSIAVSLGISRRTVGRVLTRVEAQRAASAAARPKRPSLLDPYVRAIEELLQRYPEISAQRVLEELRTRGFQGKYTIVRQCVQKLRPRPTRTPVIRFESGPGVQAQMDYGVYDIDFTQEGRRRVHLFSYVLGYSRRQYARFVEAQDFATTLREHVRAFEHLGGVAATCLYDNFKVVVSGYEADEPIYNPRFLAFATHYGFRPIACRPHRPQTKGKVEREFLYVQSSLLGGRSFRTLEHLNETIAWWLEHVADIRTLRASGHASGKTPRQLHAEEQPRLIPLPAHAYETALVVYRTVNASGFIHYRHNEYSAPWLYIGRVLPVRVTEDEVILYGPQIDEIARHRLLPRTVTGQRREEKTHRPSEDPRQRHAELQERFLELGPEARRFLDGLVRTQRYSKDHAHKVLSLLAIYARADLVAALERAVRYGAYSFNAIERILAVQAKPKTILESLAEQEREHLQPLLDENPVAPRPTAEYQPLIDKETPEHGPPRDPPSHDRSA
jgi:transposase